MADAVDLHVDADALGQVRDELRTLLRDLADLGGRCPAPADPTAMGSADVAEAVDRFRTRWREAGDHITDNLQSCLTYVDQALQGYETAESALTRQLGAPTTGPGSAP